MVRRFFGRRGLAALGLVGLVTATVVPVVAVSSSGAAAKVRGVTATTILVGGDGSTTIGGAPSPFNEGATGAMAAYAIVNKAGGIDGRKIKFVGMLTDGATATNESNNVRKLVLSDTVFAVDPITSVGDLSSTFLVQNKVPYFGYGLAPGWCNNPWAFGLNGCLENTQTRRADDTTAAVAAAYLHGGKGHKYALIFPTDQSAGLTVDIEAAKVAGFTVCYSTGAYPSGSVAPDPQPYAEAIMAACGTTGPTVVFGLGAQTPNGESGMISALRSDGWKGFDVDFAYIPAALADPSFASAFTGSFFGSDGTSLPPAGGPWEQTVEKGLKLIGKTIKITTVSEGLLFGYASAEMLIGMLKATGKNLTPTTFNKAVNTGRYVFPGIKTFMGVTPWPLDHTQQTPCGVAVKITHAKVKAGVKFQCYKDFDTTTGKVITLKDPAKGTKYKY